MLVDKVGLQSLSVQLQVPNIQGSLVMLNKKDAFGVPASQKQKSSLR